MASGSDREESDVGANVENGSYFRKTLPQPVYVTNETNDEISWRASILRILQSNKSSGYVDPARHLEPAGTDE
jgi:hypothetical protein